MKVDELLKRLENVEIPKKYSTLLTIYNTYKFFRNTSILIKYGDEFYVYRDKNPSRMLIDLDDFKIYVGIPLILATKSKVSFVILPYLRDFSHKKLETILSNVTFSKEEAEPIDVVSEFGIVTKGYKMVRERSITFEYDVTERAKEIYEKYSRPDNADVKMKPLKDIYVKIVTLKYDNEVIRIADLANKIMNVESFVTYNEVCEKLYSSSTCASAAVRHNIFKTLYKLRNYGLIDKQYVLTTVKGFAVRNVYVDAPFLEHTRDLFTDLFNEVRDNESR
jgi:hypothetical protein